MFHGGSLLNGVCAGVTEALHAVSSVSSMPPLQARKKMSENPALPRPYVCDRPLISLCMIVKDERANLETCLNSVRDLVDEMIVVDTGSSDGTQEVATRFGARVIQTNWENDFSKARNLSIDAARGTWILVLDADEFLIEKNKTAIRGLVQNHTPGTGVPNVSFNLLQKSSSDGGLTGMLVSIVRLFPNRPEIRYEWPIHEQVATSLLRAGVTIVDTPIEIIHTGYANPARNREKQRRNLAILQVQLLTGKEVSPLTHFLIGGTHLDLGDFELALASYDECQRLAADGNDLGRGARVRMATCLIKLKRPADAIASMRSDYDPSWHPELLCLRGEAEAALGRENVARLWFERVSACIDSAFVPPCNLSAVKTEALLFLGAYWKKNGNPALGLTLLRSALACRQSGADYTPAMLEAIYREHRVL